MKAGHLCWPYPPRLAPYLFANHSPELKIAMETWKEIKCEFDTVDKLDIANK